MSHPVGRAHRVSQNTSIDCRCSQHRHQVQSSQRRELQCQGQICPRGEDCWLCASCLLTHLPYSVLTRYYPQIEAKYADPLSGTYFKSLGAVVSTASQKYNDVDFQAFIEPSHALLLIICRRTGLTLTQAWTTSNVLDTKLELNDKIAQGLKAEALTHFMPSSQNFGAKLNLYFKQPNFHGRAFFDVLNGPTANIDAVLGHEGFVVGAEAGYDVNKAAITRYSAAVGYSSPLYTAAVMATNNLSVFAASYYHKVNSEVEAGAKATWDSKGSNAVGLEVASKYRLDPTSFAKVNNHADTSRILVTNCGYSIRQR